MENEDLKFRVSLATVNVAIIAMAIRNMTRPNGGEPAFINMAALPTQMQEPMRNFVKGSKGVVTMLQKDKAFFDNLEKRVTADAITVVEMSARLFEVLCCVADREKLMEIDRDIVGVLNKHIPGAIIEV